MIHDDGEYKLPEVDWVNLEAKLKEAQDEIIKQVKKKLTHSSVGDFINPFNPKYFVFLKYFWVMTATQSCTSTYREEK
jgi:hypothetical protein